MDSHPCMTPRSRPGSTAHGTRKPGTELGVLREHASHLVARRHLEVAEVEARRHGATAKRVTVAARHGSLPSACGDDVLGTLAPAEIATQLDDRMHAPLVELV